VEVESIDDLKEEKYLVLDTKFFNMKFKYKLLSEFDNLDEEINGVLINSENFGALNLLQRRYKEQVKIVYIDPPYNTEKDREKGKFIYKDGYADSSWLSLMYDRLLLAKNILHKDKGVLFESLDENEYANQVTLVSFFEHIGTIVLQTATDNNLSQVATEHEYIIAFANNKQYLDKWFGKSEAAEKIFDKYQELLLKFGSDIVSIQTELRKWIKVNKAVLPKVTHYDNVDEKGVFHDADVANTKFGGYEYDVIHPITKKYVKYLPRALGIQNIQCKRC